MKEYQYLTLDVFADEIFGGNPLAVVFGAKDLDDTLMQKIAREFNFSETTFVLPPDRPENTARVRIFTPVRELPFAGHPTVGTAVALALEGLVRLRDDQAELVFEEGVGPVPVTVRRDAGDAYRARFTTARLFERGPAVPPLADIAAVLGLTLADLGADSFQVTAGSTGVPCLLVPLQSPEALTRARLNYAAWERTLRAFWAPDLYLFCRGAAASEWRARKFVPSAGIPEDPATGSAAATLAGFLATEDPAVRAEPGRHTWRVLQGVEMGRPSTIDIDVRTKGHELVEIGVAGSAVAVMRGQLHV